MESFVKTVSGIRIALTHHRTGHDKAIIVAPGFFQSKSTSTFQKIASGLEKNFDVIAMDFRGHGKSEGLYTFSAHEAEDLKAVIDYARPFYKKLGTLAFSYAAAIAILEQAQSRNVDSLVCVSTPMASTAIELNWWTPAAWGVGLRGLEPGAGARPGNPFLKKTNAIDVISQISPVPIFFIHGDKDPTVEVRHSRFLYDKAGEPRHIKIYPGGSHAQELYRQFPADFMSDVIGWFHETL